MKAVAFGAFGGTVIAFVFWSLVGLGLPAAAGRPSVYEPSAGLIAVGAPVEHGQQQVTVIDPRASVMSVYHVEVKTGAIALKSVRNIQWDLQMTEYNSANPLPSEIRASLDHR